MKHSRFGGSNAARVIQCPGYLYASRNLPDKGSSVHAERGTRLHDIQEKIRTEQLLPTEVNIAEMFPMLTTEEVIEFESITLATYERVETVLDNYDIDNLLLEPFVTGSAPDTGGSIDLLGYNKTHAVMIDYKFGHIPVDALRNAQGLFYFMCLHQDPKYKHLVEGKKLTFVIEQPEHPTSIWELPPGALDDFIKTFTKAQQLALTEAPLSAGKYCQFCPNDAYCEQKRAYAQRALTLDPHDRESLLESIELATKLNTWKTTVMAEAERLLKGGEQIPGYKLVKKKSARKWIDPEEVEAALKGVMHKQQYFNTTLRSPAQMEKLKSVPDRLQGMFKQHTHKHSSGVTIAPESDKREAVTRVIPDKLKEIM